MSSVQQFRIVAGVIWPVKLSGKHERICAGQFARGTCAWAELANPRIAAAARRSFLISFSSILDNLRDDQRGLHYRCSSPSTYRIPRERRARSSHPKRLIRVLVEECHRGTGGGVRRTGCTSLPYRHTPRS